MRRNETKGRAPNNGAKVQKQKTLLNGRLYKTLTISLGSPLTDAEKQLKHKITPLEEELFNVNINRRYTPLTEVSKKRLQLKTTPENGETKPGYENYT